jgi:hypothetical protein
MLLHVSPCRADFSTDPARRSAPVYVLVVQERVLRLKRLATVLASGYVLAQHHHDAAIVRTRVN